MLISFIPFVLALLLAPIFLGVINRVKAVFSGRSGVPILQVYYDIAKLIQKDAVYSRTTSWVFRAGPMVGLASTLLVLAVLPFGRIPAPVSFPGDLVLFAYWFALSRFFTIIAALDTGSSFEGMGASREAQFSVFSEVALLLGLAALAIETKNSSLSGIFAHLTSQVSHGGTVHLLVGVSLLIVFLAENARIPVDDPNTHLELTMIHEVMVLDHGGIDLAYILYTDALKFWATGVLILAAFLPFQAENVYLDIFVWLAAMFVLSVFVGVIESTMARLKLTKVPHLLMGAIAASILALGFVLR